MRTGFTQNAFAASVSTPFGADVLLLDALRVDERLSSLFEMRLTMRSSQTALDPGAIIGQTIGVTLHADPPRHFSGIAVRFVNLGSQADFAQYEAVVVPALWLLTLSRNRAIWQNLKVDAIVDEVLGGFGISASKSLSASYEPIEYCVQFDETAFAFVSRLLETAGIHYTFDGVDGHHSLRLADDSTSAPTLPAAAFRPAASRAADAAGVDTFERADHQRSLLHTVDDFDPMQPTTALLATARAREGKGEWLDWPGGQSTPAQAQALARLRLQADQAGATRFHGAGTIPGFVPGARVRLHDHPRADCNADYLLVAVSHTMQDGAYRNSFEAIPATTPFRPPRQTPLPRVAGVQTATVVGPEGEEIWTDRHGRVKLRFHWDRSGRNDATCSCWVRVAQAMAGNGFGALFLPRIGHEVVVSHVDGDPARPLVTGSVYNGVQAPPVQLPADQTQSTILTRSSKKGSAGNQIRFEDKRDSEELYLHAQKDMTEVVENDQRTTLNKGSRTLTVAEGDHTIEVRKGQETHTVQGTRALTVCGQETHTDEADYTHTVRGNYTLRVGGNLAIVVDGTLNIQASDSVGIQAGTSLSSEAGTRLSNKAGTSLSHQAGTSLSVEAGASLSLQAPQISSQASAVQTVDGGGMLSLQGGMVKLN